MKHLAAGEELGVLAGSLTQGPQLPLSLMRKPKSIGGFFPANHLPLEPYTCPLSYHLRTPWLHVAFQR